MPLWYQLIDHHINTFMVLIAVVVICKTLLNFQGPKGTDL
jgi:hypothetical protein